MVSCSRRDKMNHSELLSRGPDEDRKLSGDLLTPKGAAIPTPLASCHKGKHRKMPGPVFDKVMIKSRLLL